MEKKKRKDETNYNKIVKIVQISNDLQMSFYCDKFLISHLMVDQLIEISAQLTCDSAITEVK